MEHCRLFINTGLDQQKKRGVRAKSSYVTELFVSLISIALKYCALLDLRLLEKIQTVGFI